MKKERAETQRRNLGRKLGRRRELTLGLEDT